MAEIIKRYGAKLDSVDSRDRKFSLARAPQIFPPSVDLRQWCPPIMNQGNLGSCVSHAITGVLRWHVRRGGGPDFPLSRLQIYYDTRKMENCINDDAGVEIRDGIKIAKNVGICHEDLWPYDESKFKVAPPSAVYTQAKMFDALEYERVPVSVNGLKAALVGTAPVVIGINVYSSFESKEVEKTGLVPMPDPDNEDMNGGHSMFVVGYGQRPHCFTVQNSWSEKWGDKGWCYIPERYLGSPEYGNDYWYIKNVSGA